MRLTSPDRLAQCGAPWATRPFDLFNLLLALASYPSLEGYNASEVSPLARNDHEHPQVYASPAYLPSFVRRLHKLETDARGECIRALLDPSGLLTPRWSSPSIAVFLHSVGGA